MKSRVALVFALFVALWSFLVLRGAWLQFIPHERIQSRQEKQFQTVVRLQARRGAILDRKGRDLAVSVKAYSLYADPAQVQNPRPLAHRLAAKLRMPFEPIYARLKDDEKRFVWLARKIDPEIYQQIMQWNEKGLAFVPESKRIYPNEKLLSPVLGLVGMEGQGLEGLELSLDQDLHGNSKKLLLRKDARGRPLIMDGLVFAEAPEGLEVQLTIDSEIQHELEKELEKTVSEFDADQAYGVILDVATSDVMAMAMAPGFDANRGNLVKPERRRNKTITDTFEPGSVMKTFAVAAALEEGLIQPNTKIDTEGGKLKVLDHWIREAESNHNWSSLTVSEVLAYSSNVGAAKIAFQLGDARLRSYLEKLGFGARTGVELPGEAKGFLSPLPWNQHLLSNISFGQGISTTPLQVAAAYAAIANGGVWRKPHILKSIRDVETSEIKATEHLAEDEHRVFNRETSQALRLMLMGVTAKGGTGFNARVEGFPVAGKTGTAQKANANTRGYSDGEFISSFAGFLPAQDPKYVIYIAVDNPKRTSHAGALVAAPVFSKISTFMTRLEGWAPVLLAEKNFIKKNAPNGSKSREASLGPAEVERKLSLDTQEGAALIVPQFRNWTIREVLRSLEGRKMEVRVVGSGFVHETQPAAGSLWGKGKYLTLYLRPKPTTLPRVDAAPWAEPPPAPPTIDPLLGPKTPGEPAVF